MNQKGISSILIILIIVGVLVIGGGIWYWQSQKEKEIVCPQDAKLCPDGTSVGRVPPACEFAPCPEIKDETADWKTYRNEKYGFEVKYPSDFEFTTIDYTDPDDLRKHNIEPLSVSPELLFSANFVFIEIADKGKYPNLPEGIKYGGPSYHLEIKKTNYREINDWFETWRREIETPFLYEASAEINAKIVSVEDTKIQDKQAKKVIIKGYPYLDTYFGIISQNYFYGISYDGTIKHSEEEAIQNLTDQQSEIEKQREKYADIYRNIFNQILSTFKFISPKNCDLYELPMTEEQIRECTCPDGYKKFNRLSGAYCATDSRKPCSVHTDCPTGEHCISDDGKNWFCTGRFAGCYFNDPEYPTVRFCAD